MRLQTIFASIGLFIGLFILLPRSVEAATLKFDPDSAAVGVGETLDVDVVIDAGAEQILAADIRIIYNDGLLEVSDIVDGTFFTVGKTDFETSGKIYIAAIVENPAESKTGSGTIATITFKALTDGAGKLTFVCTPGETAKDSNIAKDDIHATDIIECESNGEADITVGEGSSGSGGSDSSQGGGTGGSSSTPSTLPKSGVVEDMLKFAIPGAVLFLLGLGLKLLL